jgi:uncharacterized protein (TIGR00156 family)
MLRLKWLVGGLVTTLAVSVSSVSAQYLGPGAVKGAANVAEILKTPVDDMAVVLRGKLIKQLRGEKYTFSDGTGEIVMEIDHHRFPAQPVTETTTVEVHAEVDKHLFGKPELEAKRVTIVTQ